MKKMTLTLLLTVSLNANAGLLDFFDLSKFGQALLLIIDGMNDNLEKVRLYQHEKMDVTTQWNRMCRITSGLNQTTVELNTILVAFNFDKRTCLPLTTALQLQSDIIANCEKFNSEQVAVNTDYVLGHFMQSVEAVKQIKAECFK
jgi:hypothetical protein